MSLRNVQSSHDYNIKSDLYNIITVLKKVGLQIQATHTPFYSIPFQLVF